MKNLIKSTIILFAAALLFTGCSGFTEKQNTPKTYTVSGTLNIPGAEDNYASRTAIVSFDAVDWDVVAYPKKGTGYDSASPNYADSVTGKNFSLSLTEGDWLIEAYTHGPRDQAYFMGETTITVTNSNISNVVISVVPFDQNSGTCTVELTFKEAEGLSIDSVTADWGDGAINNDLAAQNELTAYFTGNSATLTMNNVPSGAYLVTFTFKDASEKTVYSCKEMVNVLPYATTDTWAGNSVYITPDGDFLLTQDILDSYASVELYSPTDTPYVLFSKHTKKIKTDSQINSQITSQLGFQVFDTIDNSSTITTSNAAFEAFCFTDNGIWTIEIPKDSQGDPLEEQTILVQYKQSYDGSYEGQSVSLQGILTQVTDIEGMNSFNLDNLYEIVRYLAYKDGVVYLICRFTDNRPSLLLGIDQNTKNLVYYGTLSDGYMKEADSFIITDDYYYYGRVNHLGRAPYVISGNNITIDASNKDEYLFESENLGFHIIRFGEENPAVSDLQIIDNTLYVLIYAYGESKTLYRDGEDEPTTKEAVESYTTSTGGVSKFDLSAGKNLADGPVKWDEDTTILGWYVDPSTKGNQYYSDYGDAYGEYCNGDGLPITMQPPYDPNDSSSDASFFYGARRFVAIKPKELVIADDGGYIVSENDATPKSRVVTIDLETASMSAVDVDVTFNTYADPDATAFFFCDE